MSIWETIRAWIWPPAPEVLEHEEHAHHDPQVDVELVLPADEEQADDVLLVRLQVDEPIGVGGLQEPGELLFTEPGVGRYSLGYSFADLGLDDDELWIEDPQDQVDLGEPVDQVADGCLATVLLDGEERVARIRRIGPDGRFLLADIISADGGIERVTSVEVGDVLDVLPAETPER